MTSTQIKAARKLLPAKAPAGLQKLLDSFYAKVAAEDMALLDPALMVQTAQIHWDLSRKRAKGKPAMHIRTAFLDKNNPGIGHTLIDMVNDDTAFLVDSVAAEIGQHHKLIGLLLHPILHAKFDSAGKLSALEAESGPQTKPQSHMHIQIQGAMAKEAIDELEQGLHRVLRDVGFATRDWLKMKEKLRASQSDLLQASAHYNKAEIEEFSAFLDYLHRDNFTLLGYREYRFVEKNKELKSETVKGASLGLLHDDMVPVFISENAGGLPQGLQVMRRDLPPLTISKVNRRSTVHRPVPLDAVAVKVFDKKGKVTGERLFIGLFTSVTYSRSIQDIPLLRRKADNILIKAGFRDGGHNFKALRHILEKYPRDELFQIGEKDLVKTALSILRLQERQRIALYTRRDLFGRYICCLVYVPRDRYDKRLRLAIQKILEQELEGVCADSQTNLDDSMYARVIYTINTSQENPPHYKTSAIEARLQEEGRIWSEKLANALQESGVAENEIPEVVHKYGHAFPTAYCEHYLPKQAVYDLWKSEEALAEGRIALDLYRDRECGEGQVRLKIYSPVKPVILSDILPVLENMGLSVISELPFEIRPAGGSDAIWIHDFMMTGKAPMDEKRLAQVKPVFEEALLKIWYGEAENDSLNHMVLSAQMDWRRIMILRTYVHYMRQAGSSFSTRFIERAIFSNALISRAVVDYFMALHDPARQKSAEKETQKLEQEINSGLDGVVSLEEDRILRSLLNMVQATLRTNFFQPDKNGNLKSYLAIKLDSRAVDDLPNPKPYREIFVYSTRVQGIHLRGDVIARGGLRWSDRFEDFRTEVLGLMKAQQVKNSLIVPMGAKGGFVVRNPPKEGGRAAYLQEGIECYKLFVRCLLELTDNRKGNRIVPPPHVVRRDGDDPYLVVAADKGTATFSDIANGLSAEFDFWLGDAFASGGSAGYDHKKMGITARGAWESVKRHFRELNHDTQSKPFDVIGVGDMGGDVFGNGMLLSPHIRLVGAFNHVHIFCDPDPDTEKSFAERQRLFSEVKGWDEYNTKLLSKGGRIYSRADKSLQLTPEIKARFDLDKDKVTPAELIQALLRARTDLLWFGGIGTYVKATHETNADAGDKTNDSLRVNAGDLRAKVIGEGANLAITQAARIEFAEQGGRVNADFIDNSGGVNSSDLEVNIKILLNEHMARKDNTLTRPKRDKFLEGMTGEVASLVLRNNYQQAQGISMMELRAVENLPFHAALIDDLEKKFGLNRKLEGLPDYKVIAARAQAGRGLTRPELCVLQAHTKILLTKEILKTKIPDQKEMADYWLLNYFPEPLQNKYRDEILHHRLRREIIATTLSTAFVNRMGPTFMKEVKEKTGAPEADIIESFILVREAFSLRPFWDEIEALDGKIPAQIQLKAMREIASMTMRETVWFLTRLGRHTKLNVDIAAFRKGIDVLRDCLDGVVTPEMKLSMEQRVQAGVSDGLPRDLARKIASISPLGAACDIIMASLEHKTDISVTAKVYYELGERFHLHWMRQQARFMTAESRWASEALDSMILGLYTCQAALTSRVLREMDVKASTKNGKISVVEEWSGRHESQIAQFDALIADIRRGGTLDMAMLIIASQRLQQLHSH